MKSFEQRMEELEEDPEKRARLFKVAIIVSYCSLMLGAFLIVAYLAKAVLG